MAVTQQTNVFLAYSRKDQETAQQLIAALDRHDISVWWDINSIPIGADWEEYLFDQVSAVQCVVVLWSRSSVQSKWVVYEAESAARRNVLLPVFIEEVQVPKDFSRIQAANLNHWNGAEHDPAFIQLLDAVHRFIKTSPPLAQETRIYKESQRNAERRTERLFQQNLRNEAIIEHFELEKTNFYTELSWNLSGGINVLLGRNGYGKTYLLRGLLALLQYSDQAALQTIGKGSGSVSILLDGREELIHFSDQFFDEDNAVGQIPVLAIPDTSFINRSITALAAITDKTTESGDRADLARFGAWHFLEERPYESMIQTFLYGLCLDYFEAGRSFQGEQFSLIRGVVRELTDKTFDFERVAREGPDRFTLYVRTEGNEDNPLPIQKSSQGTSSVIAMVGLIYDFLKSLKQQSHNDIRHRSGIVVIDEVDAHLHPIWQQKIATILRDRFPRVQFILTAHNPIVVAGCLEDEVTVLRKNPDHGFSLVQFPNDFIGWQAEEIYRKVFEIESSDTSFTRYDAMRPFKEKFKKEAATLAEQPTRSDEEERALEKLEEQILYIEKAEETRTQRLTQAEIERENEILRDRLLGLESAHDAAANAHREMDEFKKALVLEQQTSRKLRKTNALTTTIATGLIFVIFGLLYFSLR